ncbi:hypothetical protein SDC9_145519 [bioreactor metagenome]|uniref:Uncharacterized protein n=1 Tax=bioreactor metagenome TaxID=1076179 RepID=A0A645E8N2_9ZZZZ
MAAIKRPALAFGAFVRISIPETSMTDLTPGNFSTCPPAFSIACIPRLLDDASGKLKATIQAPWSSSGTKPEGRVFAITPITMSITAIAATTSFVCLIAFSTLTVYLVSTLAYQALKPPTILPKIPFGAVSAVRGFRIRAHKAGVKDKAIKAERAIDTEIVRANCLYSCPTVPPRNATGIKTEAKMKAIATTGPETSFIAL